MGVSDVESVKIQGRTFEAAALRNLIRPPDEKPDLTIFSGSEAIGEYNNPDLMKGMFPTLFPFGKGGFEEPQRKVTVAFDTHANYFLDIGDRSFWCHNSFIFVAMNIIQRRQAHLHTHFTVNSANFDAVSDVIEGIKPATLKAVVAKHLEEEGKVADLTAEEKKVFTLLSKVKTIAAKVTGSEASKITYRNEIRSYCGHFGIPHIFFTANPSPQNSPVFQLMCRDTAINLDERFPKMADYVKRCTRLADDPVAALDFFNFSCKAMMCCLFGWDFKKRRSSREGGILGHLKAFYGTTE
ncbi:uncharacterized protein EV420DRAFT_1261642, partial [Desarmillaria tabescens]